MSDPINGVDTRNSVQNNEVDDLFNEFDDIERNLLDEFEDDQDENNDDTSQDEMSEDDDFDGLDDELASALGDLDEEESTEESNELEDELNVDGLEDELDTSSLEDELSLDNSEDLEDELDTSSLEDELGLDNSEDELDKSLEDNINTEDLDNTQPILEDTPDDEDEIIDITGKTLHDFSEDEMGLLTSKQLEYLISLEDNSSDNADYEYIQPEPESDNLESNDSSENLDIDLENEIDRPSGIGSLESIGADHDGSIIQSDSLLTENFDVVDRDRDFISDTGDIIVMDDSENGENFKFQYIDIEKIAIVKRIRKNTTNVEDLVQSIKSTGLLEPLVVAPTATDGVYVLLAGFRRIMACAKAGKRRIPCVVNIKANIPEIPVLEAMYNHSKKYTIKETIDYIDYLEKQKGIMSASMIEFLLQLNSGDYTKLKDILNDNDDDIVSKLMEGIYTIEMAFKKLEQRRKKESAEEKENKKAARVYEDEEESGAANIAGSGDETSQDEELSEDEIKSLAISAHDLDDVDNESLEELVEEGNNIEGFQPHKQDYRERERLDPALRKSVLARDNNTCQICKIASGQEFIDTLDVHHIIEVYLGGDDNIDNLITCCTICHKLIHLYGRGDLHVRPLEEFSESEQNRFKRIIKLGTVIRKGMAAKGMKREQLKQVDKADTIGRTKPGTGQQAT